MPPARVQFLAAIRRSYEDAFPVINAKDHDAPLKSGDSFEVPVDIGHGRLLRVTVK